MTAIVFDLDGTLVDSARDLQAAANRMLDEIGQPPLPLDKIVGFIGNGIPVLVRRVMQEYGLPEGDEPDLRARMLDHYTARPADLTRPYPGVVDTLSQLRAAGHALGVCTNKARAPAMQVLDALDLRRVFDVVIGGDSLPVKKPDPAPLQAAFDTLGSAGLYVGDSEIDAETAAAAGYDFALYTQGYRKAPAATLPHVLAFDDYAVLADWITTRT